jgi:hypothetical protein
MKLEGIILALAASLLPGSALACDYLREPVDGGLSLTYFPKGTVNYSYSEAAYQTDAFRISFNSSNAGPSGGDIWLTIDWPEAGSAKASLAGLARWDLLVVWGYGKQPPPQGSSILIKGDGKELTRLVNQSFPRFADNTSGADKYFPQGLVPDLRAYSTISVEIVAPDGSIVLRKVFAMPHWSRLDGRLAKTQTRLVQLARRVDSGAPECGYWIIAD